MENKETDYTLEELAEINRSSQRNWVYTNAEICCWLTQRSTGKIKDFARKNGLGKVGSIAKTLKSGIEYGVIEKTLDRRYRITIRGKELYAQYSQETDKDKTKESSVEPMKVIELSIDLIDPLNPPTRTLNWDTISELQQSIGLHGVLQPILVRQTGDRYEIVFGNHRYYATRRAGLETIPVVIRDIPESKSLILALTENIQRVSMNPYDEGNIYKRILDDGLSVNTLSSEYLHKSVSYIMGRIKIYEGLHQELASKIGTELSITNALYLSRLDKKVQLEVYRSIDRIRSLSKDRPALINHFRRDSDEGEGGKRILRCKCPTCGSIHLKRN